MLGNEDSAISLPISAALSVADPNESLSVTITGIPTGATLSAGTHNSDGSWTLTAAQLSGLTLTPPSHYTGLLGLTVTATTSENGTVASTSASLPVTITGVALAPNLSLHTVTGTVVATDTEREGDSITTTATGHIQVNAAAFAPTITTTAATGTEDQSVALNIGVTLADSSESLSSVTISGLPTGATLSAGTHNSDGSYTLTAAQLTGLTMTPPSHWSGDSSLSVTAVSQVGSTGLTASATSSLAVHVNAIAYAPVTTATDVSGTAGTAIALNVTDMPVTTTNSEIYTAIISGLPTGATLSAGTNNGNGSWTLQVQDLGNLTIKTAASFSGDIHLTITGNTTETSNGASATSHQDFTVHVAQASPDLIQTFQTAHTG